VNLAAALTTRYEQTGDPDSLADGLHAYQEALSNVTASHPHFARALAGRAGALMRLVELRRDEPAANEAVDLANAAVHATPAGHPNRPGRLGILAGALTRRHHHIRASIDDLARAQAALQEAIQPLLPTDDRKAMLESNLGAVLLSTMPGT
jgi:hypothetical protein